MTATTSPLCIVDALGALECIGEGPILTRVTLKAKKWFDNGTYRSRRYTAYVRHNGGEDPIQFCIKHAITLYGDAEFEKDRRP